MAKKNNQPVNNNAVNKQAPKQRPVPASAPSASFIDLFKDGNVHRKGHLFIIAGIVILVWLFLSTCLNNQLTNWDDPGYIKDNALIKDLSAEGLKNIFSTPIMGNYHPITILTYAIEYSYVRLQPWLYHFDSLLLHILVTVLVYWFVFKLTGKVVAAAVAALLFGLHPMHIESVAWLAGRKDLVYAAFYMAACIAYINYVRTEEGKRTKWYIGVIALFICSLLSKPVAVVLPVTLLLIDYFEQRKFDKKVVIEKLPHFAIAVAFGIRSMIDQRAFGSLIAESQVYNAVERIGLGGYAFVTYLWKAIVPAGLSCFYPYPDKVDGVLPFVYYLYPLAIIAVATLIWKFARKNRVVIFGSLFFLVNIVLLLQFIPVGGAIVADRYSYIAYLGLFFIAGWVVSELYKPGIKTKWGVVAAGITLIYCCALGYLSNERCKVWYDTTSLWKDEIEKEPLRAPNAYNNLGFNYFNKFNESVNQAERKLYYDSSFYYLNKAIEIAPTFVNSYISLGELQRTVGNYAAAKSHYYRALSLKAGDEDANAYLGLAIIYAINRNADSAGFCFKEALRLKPYFPEAHSNYGNFLNMTGRYDESLVEYGVAIRQNPDMYAPYLNRGRALQRMKRVDEAMKDFETALLLQPDMGELYYARSYCYAMKGDKARAVQDIEKALGLGFNQIDQNYYRAMKGR